MNEIIKREFINKDKIVEAYRGGIYKNFGFEYKSKLIWISDIVEVGENQFVFLNTEDKKFDLKLTTDHGDDVIHKTDTTILELHTLDGLEFLKPYSVIKPVVELVDKDNENFEVEGYKKVELTGLLVESHLQLNQ